MCIASKCVEHESSFEMDFRLNCYMLVAANSVFIRNNIYYNFFFKFLHYCKWLNDHIDSDWLNESYFKWLYDHVIIHPSVDKFQERKADREKQKEEQNRKREEKKREKQREMDHRKVGGTSVLTGLNSACIKTKYCVW